MYNFLTLYPSYVVLAIVLIIWVGIALLLINVDRKINNLESKMEEKGRGNE